MIINRSLGVRIRYYRNKKGYTQKELAQIVGLNESTIRNYELDNRLPDANKLVDIANALEVDFYTLKCADILSSNAAAHALFDMEDLFGLVPVEIDGEVVLKLDPENSRLYEFASSQTNRVAEMDFILSSWNKIRKSFLKNEVEDVDYIAWKEQFPNFATFDEKCPPVTDKGINPNHFPKTEEND